MLNVLFLFMRSVFDWMIKEFCAPTALSESNDVLPILGRVKGLDLFETIVDKGSKTTMILE